MLLRPISIWLPREDSALRLAELAFWPANLLSHIVLFLPLALLVVPALVFPVAVFARLTLWRRDLRSLLPSLIQVGFFLTPIFWSPPAIGPMKIIFNINPIGWFLVLTKEAVLENHFRWDLFTRCIITVVVSVLLLEILQTYFKQIRKLV